MNVKSIWIIHLLKWILNIIWFLNFLFIIAGIYYLGKEYMGDTYYFNEKVTLNIHKALNEQEYISGSKIITDARVFKNEGRIMMNIKNSSLHTVMGFLGFISFGIIVTSVLFYSRKIFSNFQKGVLFSLEIVKYFKIIALFILSYSLLDYLIYLYKDWILTQNIDNYGTYFTLSWFPNLEGLLVAAIIFVLANIFKFGFELEQENKEFV